MTSANGVGARASASGNVRPQPHAQYRLLPVPMRGAQARPWNNRIDEAHGAEAALDTPGASHYLGWRIADVAKARGIGQHAAAAWLGKRGYRVAAGIVEKAPSLADVEREIGERIAAAPPSSPCFLCGAARDCEHRS